jgi:hypothetical protein
MRAALTMLLVILTDIPVEHCRVSLGIVAVDAAGGHPRVEMLRRRDVRVDRGILVRSAIAVRDGPQVVGELRERLLAFGQGLASGWPVASGGWRAGAEAHPRGGGKRALQAARRWLALAGYGRSLANSHHVQGS